MSEGRTDDDANPDDRANKSEREKANPPVETAPYKVGYKRPPIKSRFKPGRSGNISGRPRKADGALDIDDMLDKPIELARGGKVVAMEPRKITLLAQIKKARGGNLQALTHVLDQFVRFGVLGTRREKRPGGVLALPNTMPFTMAQLMAMRFGPPPWTKHQLTKGREQYLEARSESQAREDDAIGYPDL